MVPIAFSVYGDRLCHSGKSMDYHIIIPAALGTVGAITGIGSWIASARMWRHAKPLLPRVSLAIDYQRTETVVSVTVKLRNDGHRVVLVTPEGTALEIYSLADLQPQRVEEWEYSDIRAVFRLHNRVLSGETIEEDYVFPLPPGGAGIHKLALRVVIDNREYNITKIIPPISSAPVGAAEPSAAPSA